MECSRRTGRTFSSIMRPRFPVWFLLPAVLLILLLVLVSALGQETSGNLSPSIQATPGEAVSPGESVVFDASASIHGLPAEQVEEVRYIWDLGDGTVLIGERVEHRYSMSGMFSVVLTMEVFERGNVFHRATETAQVLVTDTAMPASVPVIDLGALLELAPGITAILIQAEDPVLLVTQEADSVSKPSQGLPCLLCPGLDMDRLVVSGGLLTVGELRVLDAMIAKELATDGWLGFVGLGTNLSPATFSLTDGYPVIERAGYELTSVIDRSVHVFIGLGYEVAPTVYLLGSLGTLCTEGVYQGSPRLTVDDEPLPEPFVERVVTLSFGVGLRLGWAMLSLRALLIL